MDRRSFTSFGACALLGNLAAHPATATAASADFRQRKIHMQTRLRALEASAGGRLGVHMLDSATGQQFGYRPDALFMMLSSFKLLASALVLHRVDTGQETLERRIAFTAKDLVPYSPVTEKHADGAGLSLAQLCEATLTTSDNTAANLILASYGGPSAVTQFARQLGDRVTRLDRTEPELNRKAAEPLDTTSPRAMVGSMRKLLIGNALSAPSRELLQTWLLGNTTGDKRLKAGLGPGWRIGDKTGTNALDANDIAIVWPPDRPPWLVAAYLSGSSASSQVKESVLAEVGRLIGEMAG